MSDNKTEGCLAAIVILVIGIPLAVCLYAEAAMLNWNWFATTIGAPRIGFWQAYGLTLVLRSFQGTPKHKKDDRKLGEVALEMIVAIVAAFAALAGMGWAVHAWMVSR